METCTHVRRGIVTNQVGPLDLKIPHASSQACARPECIVKVGRWVSGLTGQPAFYRADADKTRWIPVDEVRA